MAYHNLNNQPSYPDLHPSAPVRYVEMQPPVAAVPVAAQPVYAQPYTEVPYAEPPDAPYAQPVETAPPVATPVNQQQASGPGLYIPEPLTREEFDVAIQRRVQFSGCRYFRESRNFFKHNWCKLMTVTLMWAVVFLGLTCAIHRIQPDNRMGWNGLEGAHNYWNDYPEPQPGSTNMPQPSASSTSYSDQMTDPRAMFAQIPQSVRCKILLQLALLAMLAIFIAMPALAGMFVAVFNAMRTNGPIRYKDFFSCFCCRYWCRLIPLSITLKLVGGILSILIIPGIWFAFVTIFAVPLHREHKFLGTCKSIRVSMKIVHRYFCNLLGFIILNGLLQVLGFFAFGVGLLITVPLSFVALCYCYNDLIGVNGMPIIVV